MARAPVYVKSSSGQYTEAGTLIWGDTALQASEFADSFRPHRNPLSGDPDWNSLRNDYVSQSDLIAQTILSALGIGQAPATTDAVSLNAGAILGTFTSSVNAISVYNAAKFGGPSLTYKLLGIPSGTLDQNGQSSPSIIGLSFVLPIKNSGASQAISLIQGLQVNPVLASSGGTPLTGTDVDFYEATQTIIGAPGVFTNWRAFCAGVRGNTFGRSNFTNTVFIDCGTLAGVNKWFMRDQSTGAVCTVNSPYRSGDQTIPTRQHEVLGAIASKIASQTTTYTATIADSFILADATAAAFTVTLPASSAYGANNVTPNLKIKKKDSTANVVTITAAGTDTIEGVASKILLVQYQELVLFTDGSGTWYIEQPLKNTLQLINADETPSSGTVPAADTAVKTYTLAANTYSSIVAEAEGYVQESLTTANQNVNIKVKYAGTQVGQTMLFNPQALTTGAKTPFPIKASGAFTAGGAVTVTIGAAAADANTTVFLNSLRVYGVV